MDFLILIFFNAVLLLGLMAVIGVMNPLNDSPKDFIHLKTSVMKEHNLQQEILLVTNSTFSKKQWCKKETADSSEELSQIEQLEDACWNGLLNEMLPEIMQNPDSHTKIFLWQIRRGKCFLHLDLGECPLQVEKVFSIDSMLFLAGRYN